MDQRVTKLGRVLEDTGLAATLVAAGLDTPRKIKAAQDSEIEKVKGIGKAKKDAIRDRLPKYVPPK